MYLNERILKGSCCPPHSWKGKLLLMLFLLLSLGSFAQDYGPFVTLSEQDVPIEKVFKKIQGQTGFRFLYENNILQHAKKVTINVKNATIVDALQLCFANQPFSFKIIEKTVVVSEVGTQHSTSITTMRATGVVFDETTNQPIPAASVRIKGDAKKGTITNASGYFDLPALAGDHLVITCMGFEKKEVVVTGGGVTNVSMKAGANALNEVVVSNGYQELDQRTLTSAITTIKAKDIMVPGMFTIDQALEGRVPGLFVMNNSGEVGSSPKIRVRGTSTILGNQDPVWVVDGVVVNSPVNIDPQTINDLDFVNRLGNAISGLNPADIDQINVLKDASATALYGVRAANGVIVITTKKGHPGPPVITYSVSGTFTRRPRYTDDNIKMMNSRERVDYSRETIDKGINYPSNINWVGYEGALYDLDHGITDYNTFQQQVTKLETMNTDWFGAITQDAISAQHTLTISGGTNTMRYYASLGVADQPGTIKGDKLQRYNSTVNLNADITKRLQWNMSLIGDVDKRNFSAGQVNPMTYAYNTSRDIPVYDDGGGLSYYERHMSPSSPFYYKFNVLNEINNSRDISNGNSIRLNTNLNYKISNALRATALFSYTNSNTVEQTSYTANTYYAATLRQSEFGDPNISSQSLLPVGGELQTNSTRNNSYTVRGQLDYNKVFGAKQQHQYTATLGSEASSNKYYGYNTDRRGYLPDRGETFAAVDPLKYPAYAQWALLNGMDKIMDQMTNLVSGYFSNSYTYDHRYTINFNTRTDFSNKFGSSSNDKFLPTWSVSGRWDIAQDLLQHSRKVDLLAFRGSYGFQGNMLDYQTPNLIIKQGSPDPITGENGSNIAYYPNPYLRWERTGEINAAMDFSFFENKIAGSVSYFYKKTTNAFLTKQVSDVNGMDTYVVNAGNLRNTGIEVALSFTPVNNASVSGGKGFKWRIDPQLGQVINRLIARALTTTNAPNLAPGNANTYSSYLDGSALSNGKAINTFYSYQFNGLSHTDGRPTFKNDDTSYAHLYDQMSNDQVFRTVMQPSGNRIPTLQGGVSNYFSYQNFVLTFNITYSLGSKVRLMPLYPNALDGTAAALPEQNLSTDMVKRWQRPGDEAHTNIPGLLKGQDYAENVSHWTWLENKTYKYADNIWTMYDNSDVRVASGNYVKISSLQLGYKVPPRILKTWNMKDVFVSLAGTNLHTFASKELHGQDPSQAGFSAVQLSVRPTYSFNVSVSL